MQKVNVFPGLILSNQCLVNSVSTILQYENFSSFLIASNLYEGSLFASNTSDYVVDNLECNGAFNSLKAQLEWQDRLLSFLWEYEVLLWQTELNKNHSSLISFKSSSQHYPWIRTQVLNCFIFLYLLGILSHLVLRELLGATQKSPVLF